MSETVGVVVATYGDRQRWRPLVERALASVAGQTVFPDGVVWEHGTNLHSARNNGAKRFDTDYLIFLDADDELDSRYIETMLASTGDIRQPSTLGVVKGVEDREPVLIPAKRLSTGNYVVIGAMVNTDKFWSVGGFDDWEAFEDWALWLNLCANADARIVPTPAAIYRVHVNHTSRNRTIPAAKQTQLLRMIKRTYVDTAKYPDNPHL